MKTIHSKKEIRENLRYARQLIAHIERAVQTGDWEPIVQDARDLEATSSLIAYFAIDNKEGIEDFNCKYADEIAEIREQQKREKEALRQKDLAKWQKAGEQVAREFEQAFGWKVTVVTEGLETK